MTRSGHQILSNPRSIRPRPDSLPPSNGPEQLFQFIQVGGLLLSALNTYLPCQIAEPMKQKKYHEPPTQLRNRTRFRISQPRGRLRTRPGIPPAANVLGPSRSYSPQPVIRRQNR
jgi:hypothetical protein